jgi:hypothetical protein
MEPLPEPEVVSCSFDNSFHPRLATMSLSWPAGESGAGQQTWQLPAGLRLLGPPPTHFGIDIQRLDETTYSACLVWDQLAVRWTKLTRQQLADSDLQRLLAAMKTDLLYLLDQPIVNQAPKQLRAA